VKKRLLVPVLGLLLLWFAFPWILGAVGAVATLFGFKLPNLDWPIFLWLIPLLLALAWGAFMDVVGGFTELLRWLQNRAITRYAKARRALVAPVRRGL
jgi:hypothetical protein